MKKFFTLIAAVAMAASMNAQTEWNFSKWTAEDHTETYTQDGLTLYVGKDSKDKVCNITIDGNKKTVDGVQYTQRLKFNGAGKISGVTPEYRVLEFAVSGPSDIYLVMTTSNSTDAKQLTLSALETGAEELATVETVDLEAGKVVGKTVKYTGKAGKLFIYPNGGVNLYDIKVTGDASTGISNIEAASAKQGKTYNVAGQEVSASYKGLVIKNGKKYVK